MMLGVVMLGHRVVTTVGTNITCVDIHRYTLHIKACMMNL